MFKEVTIEKILSDDRKEPLIVILCPNYEERSVYLSERIKGLSDKINRPVSYEVFCLRNKYNNNMLLEGLKNRYFHLLNNNLNLIEDECEHWISYPDNFSPKELRSILKERIDSYKNETIDILADVSTMPKTVIFSLCEVFQDFIKEYKTKINNIMFAYTTPEKYSSVSYAQDMGILNGFFSGRTLRTKRRESAVHAIVFPSRSGHEGKLLLDDLNLLPYEQHHTVFFPIDTKNYLHSLELMRANQTLLDEDEYSHQFYCSYGDAIIALHEYLETETREIGNKVQNGELDKHLYLVAPFGAKIFLPISYFELQHIKHKKEISDSVEIEICHTKGFQYTSVYSLGSSSINIFQMEVSQYVSES